MISIIHTLKNSQRIGISFHTSPDGDSLGSSLALLNILRAIGKDAYIICKESIPETFTFLPNSEEVNESLGIVKPNTDCVIVLDCGNIERINGDLDLKCDEYTVINIDHHKSNEMYGKFNYVNSDSAAVGEIIYEIMISLGVSLSIDIAKCIYTSLLTDTGSFRHSSTTSNTHKIAGRLVSTGMDFSEIHRIIFENKNYKRVKLYGKVINDLELSQDEKIAFLYAKRSYFEELAIENDDTSDLICFGTKIDSAEVAILFKEKDGELKVSLRSKNIVDVREIAESYGGGGHIRAAGFTSKKSSEELKKELTIKIKEHIDGTN